MSAKDLKKTLSEIEKLAQKKSWPIIGSTKGKILESLIKEYQPKKILEIGSLVGYSSILMANHLEKGSRITTIEIEPKAVLLAKKNFKKAGVENFINIIHGDAMKIIPKLEDTYDMIFIDAAKDEYYNYLVMAENKLSPKAIVVADNVGLFEDEMRDYLEYVRMSKNYESEKFEFGPDAVEVSFRLES